MIVEMHKMVVLGGGFFARSHDHCDLVTKTLRLDECVTRNNELLI